MSTRIDAVEVWKEDLQLTRAYRIAGEEISTAVNVFILLKGSNNQIGIGAASPMPDVCGEHIDDTLLALNEIADVLRYAHVDALMDRKSSLLLPWKQFPAARAAVDTALYDLHCKGLEIPIVEFLGRRHFEMETSVTIGITDEMLVQEELMAHLQNGFRIIKIKIGEDVERDIAIVHKLKEWGGAAFRLRVDANEGYDPEAFQQFLKGTRDVNIELIEQPLASPAIDAMTAFAPAVRSKCMADEDLIHPEDAILLSERASYGTWNVKLMKCGGITPAREIAGVAERFNVGLMWGCNDESRVSITAALHTAFSCASTRFLDLDGSFDIARDIAHGGFAVKNGKLRLTDASGLGVFLA